MPQPQQIPTTANTLNQFATVWGLIQPFAARLAFLSWVWQQLGLGPLTIISGTRSCAWQVEHHRQFELGQVPYDAASRSWHTMGRAADLEGLPSPADTQASQLLILLCDILGLQWGGTFSTPDPNHIQFPGPTPPQPCW